MHHQPGYRTGTLDGVACGPASGAKIEQAQRARRLLGDRLHPKAEIHRRGSEGWWAVSDAPSAERVVDDMINCLTESGLPRLRELMERPRLIRAIRDGDLGHVKQSSPSGFLDRALAVLLVDDGPSEELASLLAQFAAEQDDRLVLYDSKFLPWLNDRLTAQSAG